jgi:predicted nuclease of predicted toxin-antitoxin system
MKLLFDHNLSPRLVKQLADLYPDSTHVYLIGMDRVDDDVIWEYARNNGYAIVSKDVDHTDRCLLRGFPPRVIWVRTGNCPTQHIENLLRKHHNAILSFENDQIVGVFTLL